MPTTNFTLMPNHGFRQHPHASVCYDPFHLVKLATDALDEIRREVWNDARREQARPSSPRNSRNSTSHSGSPGDLTEHQQLKLARVQQLNQRLYRAYLLSQQLREIYRVGLADAIALLDAWLALGRGDLAWRRSSSSRAPSPSSVRGSRRRFGTDSPTPGWISEHPAAPDHATSVRIPLSSRRDRARDAQPRRALPSPPGR